MYNDDYAFLRRMFLSPILGMTISLIFPIDRQKMVKAAFDFEGNLDVFAFGCFCSFFIYVFVLVIEGFACAREKRKIDHSHFELFGHVLWDYDIPAEDPYAKTSGEIKKMLFDDITLPLIYVSHFLAMLLGIDMGNREYSDCWDDRLSATFDLGMLILSIIIIVLIAKKLIFDYSLKIPVNTAQITKI